MSQAMSTRCYIDEYQDEQGRLSARLREKATGRKVDLGITADPDQKRQLLQFLSTARRRMDEMPDVFTKEGPADSVLVAGDLDFDAPDEIRYVCNENLSYTFA